VHKQHTVPQSISIKSQVKASNTVLKLITTK